MDALIMDFKFRHKLSIARLLGGLLANQIQQLRLALPEVLIPVPLHPLRLRERGFNQSVEIARHLMQQLHVPMDFDLCQRSKRTGVQSGLSAKERIRNMKNAFTITGENAYRHVAIVDDVMTTGQTARELAKRLKASGVKTIQVWTIARAAAPV